MKYFQTKEDLEFVLTENMKKTYEKHSHISKYVVGMMLEGSVWVENQLGKKEYFKNDIFMIPVHQVHALYILNRATRIVSVCMGMNFMEQYSIKEKKTILTEYLTEIHRQEMISDRQKNMLLNNLQTLFLRSGTGMLPYENMEISHEIAQMKNIIVKMPEMELNLEYLSERICLNKYHLIRKFKKQVGLTPHKFLIQNRIRKSQRLLRSGWKVADVAAEMGFYDQSHFIKSFQRIVRVTPKEYVQSLRQLERV